MLGNNLSMKHGLFSLLFFGIVVLALGEHIQDGLALWRNWYLAG
jgi:hypothetical protein